MPNDHVHLGAFCSPVGGDGTTTKGTPMVCTLGSGTRARWRRGSDDGGDASRPVEVGPSISVADLEEPPPGRPSAASDVDLAAATVPHAASAPSPTAPQAVTVPTHPVHRGTTTVTADPNASDPAPGHPDKTPEP